MYTSRHKTIIMFFKSLTLNTKFKKEVLIKAQSYNYVDKTLISVH